MSEILCSCIQCRVTLTSAQLTNHFNSIKCKRKLKLINVPLDLCCSFCGRTALSTNSYQQHIMRCKLNPNAIQLPTAPRRKNPNRVANNQYTKAKALNQPVPQFTEQARAKLSSHMSERNKVYWTAENRAKHSRAMQNAVAARPLSYRGAHTAGKVKRYHIADMVVIGSWEKVFAEYCIEHNIAVTQPVTGFAYTFNNRQHRYFPDFYLPAYDLYVEVKGFETDRDKCKWEQFPHRLLILRESDISEIIKGKTCSHLA